LRENNKVQDGRSLIPSLKNVNGLCSNCCQPLSGDDDVTTMKSKEEYQTHGNNRTLNVPMNETHYNSSDSNEEPGINGLSKSNLKRPHDFEDEQQNKKRRKGKSLFACFSGTWLRNNKRSKKH
jgi:hypothetical protein